MRKNRTLASWTSLTFCRTQCGGTLLFPPTPYFRPRTKHCMRQRLSFRCVAADTSAANRVVSEVRWHNPQCAENGGVVLILKYIQYIYIHRERERLILCIYTQKRSTYCNSVCEEGQQTLSLIFVRIANVVWMSLLIVQITLYNITYNITYNIK